MTSLTEMPCDTAEVAIYQETPSLVKIKKELGREFQLVFVSNILTSFAKKFNVGKNMSLEQIADTAKDITHLYYFMKPSELKYVLNKAKRGEYGKIYDRIDGPLILEWLNIYMEERDIACAKYQRAKSIQYNKDRDEQHEQDKMKEIYKNLKKQTTMKKEEPKKTQSQKNNNMFQSWLKEFDELERSGNYSTGASRFAKINDKVVSQEEFLQHKLNELNKYNETDIPEASDE